ncbi:MAG: hypothetical protein M1830_004268 [Pleopsidium flavum]|nr:MAG: hypothetical protein M1830_004268 [Pleopsidium flavum]
MARIRYTKSRPSNPSQNQPTPQPQPPPPNPPSTLNTTSQIPRKRPSTHQPNPNSTLNASTRRKRRKISAPKRAIGDGPLSPSPSPSPSPSSALSASPSASAAAKLAPRGRHGYRHQLTDGHHGLDDEPDVPCCNEDFHTMGDLSVIRAFANVKIEHGGECRSCPNVQVHEGLSFDNLDDDDNNDEDERSTVIRDRIEEWNKHATGKPHHVCATCRVHALQYLQSHRPSLFAHSALMGLCKECADTAVAKHGDPAGYDGCVCAEHRRTWFCFACRVRALERVRMRREVEEEWRRGILRTEEAVGWGADVVFVEETVWLGMRCRCGGKVEGGVRVRRCAGCEGFVVEGRAVGG